MALERLEKRFRLTAPLALMVFFFFVGFLDVPVPRIGILRPNLLLMAVYYWSVNRPTMVPPGLCFFAGLLMDILAGTPLGINALTLVAVQWVVSDQRRFLMAQPYTTVWAGFGFVAAAAALLQWALHGLASWQWLPLSTAGIALAVNLLLFPLVTLLLVAVHRILPVAARSVP